MSDQNAVECYQILADEYTEAKRLVKEISSITADVSRCLTTEPYRLTISGMGMDIPLSLGFAGKQLLCAPEQWPTAETMGTRLP